jgi:hypothetical protein
MSRGRDTRRTHAVRGTAIAAPRAASLALLLLCGCERGCLASWLAGKSGRDPQGASSAAAAWGGVDCPHGLARCAGGVVEASVFATLPSPCSGPPERCTCPWQRVGACPAACVADGVEIVVERDAALARLCAVASDADTFARPLPAPAAPPPGGCDGERYRCSGGTLVGCSPLRAVAQCLRGCAREGEEIDDDVSEAAAAALLCAR